MSGFRRHTMSVLQSEDSIGPDGKVLDPNSKRYRTEVEEVKHAEKRHRMMVRRGKCQTCKAMQERLKQHERERLQRTC